MNKKQVKNPEDLEEYYSKARRIYFKDKVPKDLEELFITLNTRTESETVFSKGGLHCSKSRARSIDDFLNISKSYFPELTVKEILIQLKDLAKLNVSNGMYSKVDIIFCPHIRKNNFIATPWANGNIDETLSNLHLSNSGFPNADFKVKDVIQ